MRAATVLTEELPKTQEERKQVPSYWPMDDQGGGH